MPRVRLSPADARLPAADVNAADAGARPMPDCVRSVPECRMW
jgi:hypothetical protein